MSTDDVIIPTFHPNSELDWVFRPPNFGHTAILYSDRAPGGRSGHVRVGHDEDPAPEVWRSGRTTKKIAKKKNFKPTSTAWVTHTHAHIARRLKRVSNAEKNSKRTKPRLETARRGQHARKKSNRFRRNGNDTSTARWRLLMHVRKPKNTGVGGGEPSSTFTR